MQDIPYGIAHLPKISTNIMRFYPGYPPLIFNDVGKEGVISYLVLKKGLGSDPEGSNAWISRLMPYLISHSLMLALN
jgi:hypothetical protein